ncbi:DUF6473 family protein [Rhodococcus sp. SJ-2]
MYTIDYSPRDHEVAEYGTYELEGLDGYPLRGPAVDVFGRDDYVTCMGAAQTLGVYVANPYPNLIAQKTGRAMWNVGVGAATPAYFLENPKLIELANKGAGVVLQIMTARTEPNDRMAQMKTASVMRDLRRGDEADSVVIWERIQDEEPENLQKYARQSVEAWEQHMQELIDAFDVPVVLFWFSPKSLDASIDFDGSGYSGTIDEYPQFVTGRNVAKLSGYEELVVCSSDRAKTFPLLSRYTGEQVSVDYTAIDRTGKMPSHFEDVNTYYPSPEMHWDAAEALEPAVARMGNGER